MNGLLVVLLDWLKVVLAGMVGAGAYGFSGYLKRKEYEPFDLDKLAKTLCIGFIVGILALVLGMGTVDAWTWAQTTGLLGFITAVIENIWKAIKRRQEAKTI